MFKRVETLDEKRSGVISGRPQAVIKKKSHSLSYISLSLYSLTICLQQISLKRKSLSSSALNIDMGIDILASSGKRVQRKVNFFLTEKVLIRLIAKRRERAFYSHICEQRRH